MMVKMTLSVSNVYKNTGAFRFHRKNTTKHWKHYFIEDYFDDGDWKFSSEWVSAFKARLLKRKQVYKRRFLCMECGKIWQGYVPKNTKSIECPECD